MTVSINGSGAITFNDASTQSTAATGFGFKNRIINGAMVIDQRNAGASVSVTSASPSNTFSCDRFKLTNQTDGTYTAQQSNTAPAGFINSLLITSTVADTSIGAAQYAQVGQRVEGNNVADLGWGTANAQAVTLSFWVRSNLTGTFCATLYNSNGSRSYVSTYTISVANTWEQKTITVAGDTGGTWQTGTSTGIDVIFCLAVGSTYQQAAGSWGTTSFAIGTSGQTNFMASTSNTFYITGVQLEKGSTATSFDYRPYGTELALCQRYYEVIGSPGQGDLIVSGYASASGQILRINYQFKVNKRIVNCTMTVVGTWPINTMGQPLIAGSPGDANFRIDATSTASGICYVYNGNAGNCITASAEL